MNDKKSSRASNLGVLWDLDGVLIDTAEFHYQSWVEMLGQRQKPFQRDDFRKIFGMDNEQTLRGIFGQQITTELCNELSEEKEALFRTSIQGKAKLLAGVQSWLDKFRELGVPQALASSAPPENVKALLEETRIAAYFQACVGPEGIPGKPDPAIFLKAAELIGRQPQNCLVIEDSLHGVKAAKKGGMKCLAVTTTFPATQLFDADRVVNSLLEVSPEDIFQALGMAYP